LFVLHSVVICFDFNLQTTAKLMNCETPIGIFIKAGQMRKNRCENYEIRKICIWSNI